MAASATFALTDGEGLRRARLPMVSPDSRAYRARRQAETPLSVLCRFPGPALCTRGQQRACVSILGQAAIGRRHSRGHRPDAALVRLETPIGRGRKQKTRGARSAFFAIVSVRG